MRRAARNSSPWRKKKATFMSTSSVVSQVSLYQRCYRSRVRIKLDPKAISTISKTSRRKEFLRVYKFDVDLNTD